MSNSNRFVYEKKPLSRGRPVEMEEPVPVHVSTDDFVKKALEDMRSYHVNMCDQVLVKLNEFKEEKKRFIWCYRVGLVFLLIIMLCIGLLVGFIGGTQLVMPR